MKIYRIATFLVVGLLLAASSVAEAAEVRNVAVIDIGYIYKNHPGFKSTMDNMKAQVQAYEDQLRQRHQELAKDQAVLSELKAGSADYKKQEELLARKTADMQTDTQLKRKEFLDREAREYFKFYQGVQQAVQEFSVANRIQLVLRFNRDEIDPEDRASVLQGVNRPVVFQHQLDITEQILMRLSEQRAAARPAPAARTPR